MDIPEWMSGTSPIVWKALQFSTLTVCVLGILGNVSSVAVLGRHMSEIPGSMLLLALGIADLGVVTAVTARILAYVVNGYSVFTRVLEWWFLYCYYCSIYLTILLSVDRYMQSAKSMLLLKINYKEILKRAILAVFGAMFVVALPHLLGNLIKYNQKPHLLRLLPCEYRVARSLCEEVKWFAILPCDQFDGNESLLTKAVHDVVYAMCKSEEKTNYRTICKNRQISISAPKFTKTFAMAYSPLILHVCYNKADFMRHDPDFVKALYLGMDLSLRYIIPSVILGAINILLVLAVRRAQIQHAVITGEARVSLFKLPILKTVVMIVFVFLICHAGGSAIFILDILRAFRGSTDVTGRDVTNTNTLMDSSLHAHAVIFKELGFLLATVNSSVNILVYCFFLPVFRSFWKKMHAPHISREQVQNEAGSPPLTEASLIPWEDLQSTEDDCRVGCSSKILTRCATVTSLPQILIENRCVLLRLSLAAGIGILLLVGSTWAVWNKSEVGYTGLRPLYYSILDDDTFESICVSGNFLVGFRKHRRKWRFLMKLFGYRRNYFRSTYISTYSLPDLQPKNIVSPSDYCVNVRADSDGQVYAGCNRMVSVLETSETGDISVTRNLTAGGLLTGRRNAVAGFGPSPGQVWVHVISYENATVIKVYLIDANTDSVIQMFTPDPRDIPSSWASVAALGHKILIHGWNGYGVLLLYDSHTTSPTNLTRSGEFSPILSYNNHFLLHDWESRIGILDNKGELLHTWDDLNGKHGFWMQIVDAGFWKNNLIVLGSVGDVAIFSMV